MNLPLTPATSASTTQRIALAHGPFLLHLQPETGGCIAGFWRDGIAVLRSLAADEDLPSVRLSASYPLVPFSNRIGQGQFKWLGKLQTLAANFLPEPHAIHGVAWQRPWEVLDCSATSARLGYSHRPDTLEKHAAWPFAFDCIQTFTLDDNGLSMALELSNRETHQNMPAGLGFHPYFVKRPDSHVTFSTTGRWEMDPLSLPTERLPSPGLDRACAGLDIDHCFDGWQGTVQLRDRLLNVGITSSMPCLVVYTQPGRDFIAIEPVSHVNNALGMNKAAQNTAQLESWGVKILSPGAAFSVQMRIEVRTIETIFDTNHQEPA